MSSLSLPRLENSGISAECLLGKKYDSKNGELGENQSKVVVTTRTNHRTRNKSHPVQYIVSQISRFANALKQLACLGECV